MDYKRGEINISKSVGRNEPCPCGSNKKFKKCCLPVENSKMAQLSADDCKFFFKTFFGMLGYVNAKLNVTEPEFSPNTIDMNSKKVVMIRNALWENPHLIGEYADFMEFEQDISMRELDLLKSWEKNYIIGQFLIIKYTPEYAVFVQVENKDSIGVYAVKGLTDSVAFVTKKQTPLMLTATLMPFEGKIIYDGLISIDPDIKYPDELIAALEKEYHDLIETYGLTTKF